MIDQMPVKAKGFNRTLLRPMSLALSLVFSSFMVASEAALAMPSNGMNHDHVLGSGEVRTPDAVIGMAGVEWDVITQEANKDREARIAAAVFAVDHMGSQNWTDIFRNGESSPLRENVASASSVVSDIFENTDGSHQVILTVSFKDISGEEVAQGLANYRVTRNDDAGFGTGRSVGYLSVAYYSGSYQVSGSVTTVIGGDADISYTVSANYDDSETASSDPSVVYDPMAGLYDTGSMDDAFGYTDPSSELLGEVTSDIDGSFDDGYDASSDTSVDEAGSEDPWTDGSYDDIYFDPTLSVYGENLVADPAQAVWTQSDPETAPMPDTNTYFGDGTLQSTTEHSTDGTVTTITYIQGGHGAVDRIRVEDIVGDYTVRTGSGRLVEQYIVNGVHTMWYENGTVMSETSTTGTYPMTTVNYDRDGRVLSSYYQSTESSWESSVYSYFPDGRMASEEYYESSYGNETRNRTEFDISGKVVYSEWSSPTLNAGGTLSYGTYRLENGIATIEGFNADIWGGERYRQVTDASGRVLEVLKQFEYNSDPELGFGVTAYAYSSDGDSYSETVRFGDGSVVTTRLNGTGDEATVVEAPGDREAGASPLAELIKLFRYAYQAGPSFYYRPLHSTSSSGANGPSGTGAASGSPNPTSTAAVEDVLTQIRKIAKGLIGINNADAHNRASEYLNELRSITASFIASRAGKALHAVLADPSVRSPQADAFSAKAASNPGGVAAVAASGAAVIVHSEGQMTARSVLAQGQMLAADLGLRIGRLIDASGAVSYRDAILESLQLGLSPLSWLYEQASHVHLRTADNGRDADTAPRSGAPASGLVRAVKALIADLVRLRTGSPAGARTIAGNDLHVDHDMRDSETADAMMRPSGSVLAAPTDLTRLMKDQTTRQLRRVMVNIVFKDALKVVKAVIDLGNAYRFDPTGLGMSVVGALS